MNYLKEKILEKIEHLPDNKLQEVLDFVEFLGLTEEKNEQIEENYITEYVEGVLVVKTQGSKNWETAVHDLREERIQKFIAW
ncbi:DUF2281 domain-containing protein [Fortiea sp. LEGE XX443]|uniref:DUF2281 domain-containing protein n=1 Tax=Fortiea sp. LEGE XX443 TaxID=1828611 RepID=UPI00187E13C7|nr:DUF2281 domain-containing protein [Fortiea sp. LEGE XX443]MBE9007424.1 DUF2281 domain-containing protein [Fortiea sp. LEGE XX443]